MSTTSACALETPGRDRPDADLGHELDVDPGPVVGVLQVVDELGEVLDRVDVVVRRRGDEPDARRRVPGLGDVRVHLRPGQLPALAGLGALGHLDLDVVGVHEVLARHAEASGGDLLDGAAALGVVQALGVLAALSGVAAPAEAVHRDGERLVGLGADRAERHRAGVEALHDLAHRLDLVDRHRRADALLQPEQAPQGAGALGQRVDGRGVLLEDVVLLRAGRVLQLEHRLRVEQVHLALAAPLVLPAGLEPAVGPLGGVLRVGPAVARRDLRGDDLEADAAEPARRAGEVLVDELLREPERLEDLRAGVGRDGRDAHLAHHLEHALAGGLDVLLHRLAAVDARAGRRCR
jgi:hypothetical protein